MFTIDQDIYHQMARQLIGMIGCDGFFNGTAEYDTEEFCSRLTATLLIYRRGESIADIVPVWWEFHLVQPDGEVLTDFCWHELRRYLEPLF